MAQQAQIIHLVAPLLSWDLQKENQQFRGGYKRLKENKDCSKGMDDDSLCQVGECFGENYTIESFGGAYIVEL